MKDAFGAFTCVPVVEPGIQKGFIRIAYNCGQNTKLYMRDSLYFDSPMNRFMYQLVLKEIGNKDPVAEVYNSLADKNALLAMYDFPERGVGPRTRKILFFMGLTREKDGVGMYPERVMRYGFLRAVRMDPKDRPVVTDSNGGQNYCFKNFIIEDFERLGYLPKVPVRACNSIRDCKECA